MRKWLLLLAAYGVLALLFGGRIQDPDLTRSWLAPGPGGLLGTDQLGRDVLGWTLAGARVAVVVGLLAACIATALGALAGLLAGWFGGRVDATLLGIAGTVSALPGILLILVLAYLLGGGYVGVFAAVGLVSWVAVYRVVRSEVRRLRGLPYVEAALLHGAPAAHVLRRHLLPNLAPLLLVQFTLLFTWAVKAEVILSFLGVGMQDAPSWGLMMADAWGFEDLENGHWWRLAAATLAMLGLVLPVQRLGDRLAQSRSADS